MSSTRRPANPLVKFLKHVRTSLEELRHTLEPLFQIIDMIIVRGLLVHLLIEKAWTVVQ